MSKSLERWQSLRNDLPDSIQLMVVTKGQPSNAIDPLLAAGQRLFGENRVQEACQKWPALRKRYPDLQLHGIGPLQTNKVKEALAAFDAIQSIDRPKLVDALVQQRHLFRPHFFTLIQINVGREPQKSGVNPEDFSGFYAYCQERNLPVKGIMCIPPKSENSTAYFHTLAQLARDYQLPVVSMGMSDDFNQAIACGSTLVRVGSRIFKDA